MGTHYQIVDKWDNNITLLAPYSFYALLKTQTLDHMMIYKALLSKLRVTAPLHACHKQAYTVSCNSSSSHTRNGGGIGLLYWLE